MFQLLVDQRPRFVEPEGEFVNAKLADTPSQRRRARIRGRVVVAALLVAGVALTLVLERSDGLLALFLVLLFVLSFGLMLVPTFLFPRALVKLAVERGPLAPWVLDSYFEYATRAHPDSYDG
jgi:hypothetical protein